MNNQDQHIIDNLTARLVDPSTPAADLAEIAKARNAVLHGLSHADLSSAGVLALTAVTQLAEEMRHSEQEAARDRHEWRQKRLEDDTLLKKLKAENAKLKKQIKSST